MRKCANTANIDSESRELLLSTYRGHFGELGYGNLDPDLVDDDKPFLNFDLLSNMLTE